MLVPMEKPKDKGERRHCIGIVLGLVDRSDKVVAGTIEKSCQSTVGRRMPEAQRGDARDTMSVMRVPWQQSSAKSAEGEMVIMACVVSVRMTGTIMEPREYKVR